MPCPSPLTALLLIFLLLFCFTHRLDASPSPLPDRYFKSVPASLRRNASDEYVELTIPLQTDSISPSCSLPLLQEDFGNTIGSPPASVVYSPPSDCPGPWTHVVLELSASCQGEQYDRIAGVWLDGVEILRTSTAEPTESGIFWKVRKDVTRYSSLLVQSNITLTMMLENIVNDVFTGVYHVNISVLYYGESKPRVSSGIPDRSLNRKLGVLTGKTVDPIDQKEGIQGYEDDEFALTIVKSTDERLGFQSELKKLGSISNEAGDRTKGQEKSGLVDKKPADLIIPISDNGGEGFWFRIQKESDVRSKEIQIPLNTYKAVLEIYVSFHGNDEFWYSNPPDSYIQKNNLTTGRGNGAFRQVFATIDGVLVGWEVPFPVIFTGGINPLFWEPVVAIGAFNLPSYDIDLTPFLGLILDGKNHHFGLGVIDSIPFWLVDANLHLWLHPKSSNVQAKPVHYHVPPLKVRRESKMEKLDGSFKIESKRKTHFSGWVSSSAGNFTTRISQHFKFKNSIKFEKNGMVKEVKQKIKVKTEVRVESETGDFVTETIFKRKYPLKIITSTLPGLDENSYLLVTNVSHALDEKSFNGGFLNSLSNNQDSGGWMVVQDHSVLSGTAETRQTLSYKDGFSCYYRSVTARNGKLLDNNSTVACAQSS